jgi:hypothetical protein
MAVKIVEPAPYKAMTNVLCQGTGQIGSICACGRASDAKHGGISGVWAQGYKISDSPPNAHTTGAQPGSYDDTGNWWFLHAQLVPNIPCVSHPTDNTYALRVWCTFQGSATELYDTAHFAARCATTTNCVGTGDPCVQFARRHPDAATSAAGTGTSTVSTAARQYQVKAQGARGPLASLVNTTWVLSLKTGGCGCTFAWDNEGDGIRVARVVLRPDGVISTEWSLTLVLNGRRAQYACSAREWNALGVNRMRRVSGDDIVPETLIVRPL